jgi:hypothetical protein
MHICKAHKPRHNANLTKELASQRTRTAQNELTNYDKKKNGA